jgi:hypothetical protein
VCTTVADVVGALPRVVEHEVEATRAQVGRSRAARLEHRGERRRAVEEELPRVELGRVLGERRLRAARAALVDEQDVAELEVRGPDRAVGHVGRALARTAGEEHDRRARLGGGALQARDGQLDARAIVTDMVERDGDETDVGLVRDGAGPEAARLAGKRRGRALLGGETRGEERAGERHGTPPETVK